MNLFQLTEKLTKKMKWYDVSLLKLTVLFSTLALVTGWGAFRELVFKLDWYWYAVAAIILSIPIFKKMFCK
ncbi:MAG: hypothetical protein PF569_00525 [Candidatus Woesearchaeota archaeon]|jgi:hypothetical protein|nr:hypothetical protein [Candidatus Woesearchaeota archaeon]